jgi:hypothetical protein
MKLEENGRANPQVETRVKDVDLFPTNRGEYFASRNNELNEKIEMIRRKYAA